jgi:hypothetical protein
VYKQQQEQQQQEQQQQDAENPFLDPPFSRIKSLFFSVQEGAHNQFTVANRVKAPRQPFYYVDKCLQRK